MPSRFIVAPGQGFNYPADLISLQIIKSAGGWSKLSAEDRLRVTYKRVEAGEDCGDLPKDTLKLWLSEGLVIDTEAVIPTEEEIPIVIEETNNE
jgi:hypothetical protein